MHDDPRIREKENDRAALKDEVARIVSAAPEQAVADGKGMIDDNLEDKNEVIGIDARTFRITSRWPVAPAGQPVSAAMDRQTRRLFVAGRPDHARYDERR